MPRTLVVLLVLRRDITLGNNAAADDLVSLLGWTKVLARALVDFGRISP